jgi:hypothetical protein
MKSNLTISVKYVNGEKEAMAIPHGGSSSMGMKTVLV